MPHERSPSKGMRRASTVYTKFSTFTVWPCQAQAKAHIVNKKRSWRWVPFTLPRVSNHVFCASTVSRNATDPAVRIMRARSPRPSWQSTRPTHAKAQMSVYPSFLCASRRAPANQYPDERSKGEKRASDRISASVASCQTVLLSHWRREILKNVQITHTSPP